MLSGAQDLEWQWLLVLLVAHLDLVGLLIIYYKQMV